VIAERPPASPPAKRMRPSAAGSAPSRPTRASSRSAGCSRVRMPWG